MSLVEKAPRSHRMKSIYCVLQGTLEFGIEFKVQIDCIPQACHDRNTDSRVHNRLSSVATLRGLQTTFF